MKRKQQRNKKLVLSALALTVMLTAVPYIAEPEVEEPPGKVATEPAKQVVTKVAEPKVRTFDIPLEKDLQLYIFELAERYGIDPELIIAVIWQESKFKADEIGDGGRSFGLMQVQEFHHKERMEKFNVTNLLNPYENVLIGTDYLAELIELGGVEWALMCYNGGFTYANEKQNQGVISEYAESVLMYSDLLKGSGK